MPYGTKALLCNDLAIGIELIDALEQGVHVGALELAYTKVIAKVVGSLAGRWVGVLYAVRECAITVVDVIVANTWAKKK